MSTERTLPQAEHLLVVSDMHITQEQPTGSLWKRFLQRDRFVDKDFSEWLGGMQDQIDGPIRLVLNGDIFDFDAVMALPDNALGLTHVERTRSLHPTEPKSAFKVDRIIGDHPVFFDALQAFLSAGHRIVVILGNHDVELFWPSVQERIRARLDAEATDDALRFEPWFYQSGDVRVEHGHLLDPWCTVRDPLQPVLESDDGERHVEIPFGNIAGRYMINRMGYFNPNCSESYQRTVWGYLVFWARHHLLRLKPLLTAWLAGAAFTLAHAWRIRRWRPVRDGTSLPPPYAPTVYRRWFLMVRELWFDRLAIAGTGLAIIVSLMVALGPGLWLLPTCAGLLAGVFVWDLVVKRFVERSDRWLETMHDGALAVARAAKARILVLGHSHQWRKEALPGGGYYLNSGNFSPSYHDLECNQPVPHSRTFVWIPPSGEPLVLEWQASRPVVLG